MSFKTKMLMTMIAYSALYSKCMSETDNKYEEELKECLLPECKEKTTHNGGYCCAEHCKEHRRSLLVKREVL